MRFLTPEDFLKLSESSRALKFKPLGSFPDVAESAHPFVAALLLRRIPQRVWLVCNDVRSQEEFAAELAAWCPRVRLFPDMELPGPDALPDAETESERLDLLRILASESKDDVIVIHAAQWESPTTAKNAVLREIFTLRCGQRIPIEEVIERLDAAGYECAPQIAARGQFARRGGILDIFSWQQPRPIRVEWYDVEIESLREFDLDTQTSVGAIDHCEIFTGKSGSNEGVLLDYLRKEDVVITIDSEASDGGISIGAGESSAKFPF